MKLTIEQAATRVEQGSEALLELLEATTEEIKCQNSALIELSTRIKELEDWKKRLL